MEEQMKEWPEPFSTTDGKTSMLATMQEQVKDWLDQDKMDLFLGYKMVNGHPLPHFFTKDNMDEVDDLIDGLIRLAESNVSEAVNLGNPTEMTVNDFADIVEQLAGPTGREYRNLPVSDPVRRRPDITRAQTLLGWQPATPLEAGLRSTLNYLSALDR